MTRSAVLGTAIALVVGSPWLLVGVGSGRLPVLSGLVAWRGLATTALDGLVLLVAVLGVNRRCRLASMGVGIPLAVLGTVVVLGRGLAGGVAPAPDAGQLRVLSSNTNGDLVDAATIADETVTHDADLLVLPDIADPEYLRLRELLATDGYAALHRAGAETAIFSRVGYQVADQQAYDVEPRRQLVVRPEDSRDPTIVAVRLNIPLLPGGNRSWNRQVDQLAEFCAAASADGAVLVGDFNATTDNLTGTGLTTCTDAATATGSGSVGTWPSALPSALSSVLGIPIDHVLTYGDHVQATGFAVLTDQDDSGARHRPVLATIETSATAGSPG